MDCSESKSPIIFILFSFTISILNFLDTFLRLMYPSMFRAAYPLEINFKPIFFLAQAGSTLFFVWSLRRVQKPTVHEAALSRLFNVHSVLAVLVILLYVDFQVTAALTRMSYFNAFLQLLLYLVYLIALSGTCFWFAKKLKNKNDWRQYSVVLILVGLSFLAVVLEPASFWSQNYLNLTVPGQLATIIIYAPHVLMALASTLAFILVSKHVSVKAAFPWWFAAALFALAFSAPILWDGYREGLINFIIYDILYWGLGYSGATWLSVSLYLMVFVAYVLMWRLLSKRSDRSLAFSLIVLGVASLPWNGVVLLRDGYSSIPGNMISLSSIIAGYFYEFRGEE